MQADPGRKSRPENAADAVHTVQLILKQRGISAGQNAEETRRAVQAARSALEGRVRTVLEKQLEIRRHVTTEEDPAADDDVSSSLSTATIKRREPTLPVPRPWKPKNEWAGFVTDLGRDGF